ncbi:hypothetical protein K7432_009470 [Basidiobolus ranarum]|uniref:Uncharacterized protein n=1 Tax=Basidiobolus ranarum TaxID=34480 RepID=A0ABR2WQ70_9FUNG
MAYYQIEPQQKVQKKMPLKSHHSTNHTTTVNVQATLVPKESWNPFSVADILRSPPIRRKSYGDLFASDYISFPHHYEDEERFERIAT